MIVIAGTASHNAFNSATAADVDIGGPSLIVFLTQLPVLVAKSPFPILSMKLSVESPDNHELYDASTPKLVGVDAPYDNDC
jgi:hypothetical protein